MEILKSSTFERWLGALRDDKAVRRILARIDRLALGNPGDVKPVGDGICEMRIDHGPGYRVYFMRRGSLLILLLCGGNKSSQDDDIKVAKAIATEWKQNHA